MKTPNRSQRAWVYGVVAAVLTLLAVYGVLEPDKLDAWLDVVGKLLGVGAAGLALANLSDDKSDRRSDDSLG